METVSARVFISLFLHLMLRRNNSCINRKCWQLGFLQFLEVSSETTKIKEAIYLAEKYNPLVFEKSEIYSINTQVFVKTGTVECEVKGSALYLYWLFVF